MDAHSPLNAVREMSGNATSMKRREFIVGSAAGILGAASAVSLGGCANPSTPARPHRYIDPAACIGCGECVSLCPMGAIRLGDEAASIDPNECAECGACLRSRVCPAVAIRPGRLAWPRTLREAFSNPLVVHEATGVRGRGTEGMKTNDSTGRYPHGVLGIFIELGRPALGTRFVDVERAVRKFSARGFALAPDNPVAGLVADPARGTLRPEVLQEKALSVLVEFIVPEAAAAEVKGLLEELAAEVETVFSVSIALRAAADGTSRLDSLFGPEVFRLPNGKVNLGLAKGLSSRGA
jgi:ferredoxin